MSSIEALQATMAKLRGPEGCPWDREQDHKSLARCLMEECAELLDTIDRGDMDHMKEELGDVLLQVVFHARMAEEAGHFDFDAVAAEINRKLLRRHPHVFGDMDLADSAAVLVEWEKIKAREKKGASVANRDGIFSKLPRALPALLYAWSLVKEVDKRGRGLPDEIPASSERIDALAEGLDEEKAGVLLFEAAAACRRAGVDPESALRRFARRVGEAAERESSRSSTVSDR